MRRLILWIIGLIAIFSLTALIPILIGRRQPLPERVAMLHLTDCELPCWIGNVPGKTTVGEARDRVRQTYPHLEFTYFTDERGLYVFGMDSERFEVQFGVKYEATSNAVVENIWLYPKRYPSVSLGELYSILGPPDMIWPAPENQMTAYLSSRKPHVFIGIHRVACGKVTPSQEVHSIPLDARFSFDNLLLSFYPQPWRGFRTCYNRTP
jgi:hypothetical protein